MTPKRPTGPPKKPGLKAKKPATKRQQIGIWRKGPIAFGVAALLVILLAHRVWTVAHSGPRVGTLIGSWQEDLGHFRTTWTSLPEPNVLTTDRAGNIYVHGAGWALYRVTARGEITAFRMQSTTDNARYGDAIGIGGFIAVDAHFPSSSAGFLDRPGCVASDPSGNLYVIDEETYIKKITPSGQVKILAGGRTGAFSFQTYANGKGREARFFGPGGLIADEAGFLYLADGDNRCIRKISPDGDVSCLAGRGPRFRHDISAPIVFDGVQPDETYGDNDTGIMATIDGIGDMARFGSPRAISIDSEGNVYVGDDGNDSLRVVSPSGEVRTLAGGNHGFTDGLGQRAKFGSVDGIAVAANGMIYVADGENNCIRQVTQAGEVTTLTGTSEPGFVDGALTKARFNHPLDVTVGENEKGVPVLLVADSGNNAIRTISLPTTARR